MPATEVERANLVFQKMKAELYRQLADVNREIRRARKEISMCDTIERNRPQMEHDIHVAEAKAKEVERDEYRRR